MKRKVRSTMKGHLDKKRFMEIPPEEIIETTDLVIDGMVKTHYHYCTEGDVWIDVIELESSSVPV